MRESEDRLTYEAGLCLSYLRDADADPAERARWQAWLDADPAHRAAYARAVWLLGTPIDRTAVRWPDAASLAADTYDGSAPLKLPDTKRQRVVTEPPKRRRVWIPAAIAASIAILGLFLLQPLSEGGPQTVLRTAYGEHRDVRLVDGSELVLGAAAELEVAFDPQVRALELRRGEALFRVAHDTVHPFLVRTNAAEIRAVGTAFDVRVAPGGVTVTVLEGIVAVAPHAGASDTAAAHPPVQLVAGQQMTIGSISDAVRTVDPAAAGAWQEGHLSYIDRPFSDVLADLDRWAPGSIVLGDPSLASLRYTGTVFVQDLPGWAAAVARAYPVTLEKRGRKLLLMRRD